jgi:DNA gyrase subunit A
MKDDIKKNEIQPTADGIQEGVAAGLVDVDISDEVRSAFLDYSMSVIVSRAIPDVRDGLKPVHRRIIYGMNELGMQPDKPYKKCARIVGDVMGKFHPHGDQAIYSTLVRLAQPFSMRYPLVDGHGNFGSVDGDEAAAMRYTEARMAKMALEMVRDINSEPVDFADNYDGTEKEPVVLPSRFPNLLVNGSSGIAVGMATNMPPHNLREVVGAIKALAHNPDITVLELMTNYLFGPDFPTGGSILGKGGIRQAYETGTGSITIRSKVDIVDKDNGKKQIIIKEIPYQVNKATMIEAIAQLVKDKVIEGITDIRTNPTKTGSASSSNCGRRRPGSHRQPAVQEHPASSLVRDHQPGSRQRRTESVAADPDAQPLPDPPDPRGRTPDPLLAQESRGPHPHRGGYLIAIDHIDEVIAIIKANTFVDEAKEKLMAALGSRNGKPRKSSTCSCGGWRHGNQQASRRKNRFGQQNQIL